MAERTYEATTTQDSDGNEVPKRSASISFDPGDSLDDAVERFGEKVVFSLYEAKLRIKLQGAIRGLLKQGLDEEEIQDELDEWRPDVSRRRTKDPTKSISDSFGQLSQDQQDEMLNLLRAQMEQEEAAE